MRKIRKRLKTTIAMLTLIATVIETGFSSVAVYAADVITDDPTEINIDIDDSVVTNDAVVEDDVQVDSVVVQDEPGI